MTYIGVDLHKDSMSIVGCDVAGAILVKERIPCKCTGKVAEFFLRPELHPCTVAVEAIGFYHWFFDLLEGKVEHLILTNTVEARKYSWDEPKTDFRDAYKLARLLAGGEFARNKKLNCFVPDKTLRSFRELTRHRHGLVLHHTSLVNSAHRILLKNNLPGPKILNGSSLEVFMTRFGDRFSICQRQMLLQISQNLFYNERQLREIETEIESYVRMDRFRELYAVLTSVPGVALLVAATLIAEIGDFSRFQRPDRLAAYAGLVAKVYSSDETVRYGRITKRGSPFIRRALINASWVAIRHDEKPRRVFTRIAKRAGRKKAIVAIARKLLVWMWHLATEKESWDSAADRLTKNKSGVTLLGFMKCPEKATSVA